MEHVPNVTEPSAVTADTTDAAKSAYLPDAHRRGVALALSGGGSRAALFHLGVLRRLNEVGVLSQVDTISSVSGGSILAGYLAAHLTSWPAAGQAIADFDTTIVPGLVSVVRRNMRTPPIARRWLYPRNWFNDQASIEALVALFETYVNGARLADLPAFGPRFVFCASDNAFGVNWISTRDRIGDYRAGYWSPGEWTVGRAVAASACFPPVFDPMRTNLDPAQRLPGHVPDGKPPDDVVRGIRLSDGGLYDNLALEPVWKDKAILIASDGGALFSPQPDQGLFKRLKRYATVMGRQTSSLRKRWLVSNYITGILKGVYVGVGTPVARYELSDPEPRGYSVGLVEGLIAGVRTDLDRCSVGETVVLQNHGYFVAEAGLRKHLASTDLQILDVPPKPPYAEWMDEQKVSEALKDSSKTKLPFGRGPWVRYLGPKATWPKP